MIRVLSLFVFKLMIILFLTNYIFLIVHKKKWFKLATIQAGTRSSATWERFAQINTIEWIESRSNKSQISVVFLKTDTTLGYGNRIYSMLSAFLVAILTDSVLLIDWPGIEANIQPPFELTFDRFNGQSTVLDVGNVNDLHYLSTETINSWNPNKQLIQYITIPEDVQRIFINTTNGYFFDLCLNRRYLPKLVNYGLVKNETVQRALNSLDQPNLLLEQKLEFFLLAGFEYAGAILNRHWRLVSSLHEKILNFQQIHLVNKYVIGIQLRYMFVEHSDIELFFKCAEQAELTAMRSLNKSEFAWYVSTDEPWRLADLQKRYEGKMFMGEGPVGHIAFSKEDEKNVYERTLFDLEMLSQCDELVITGGSTYGFAAAMKSQRKPLYVESFQDMKQCQRLNLFRPSSRTYNGHKFAIF